MSHFGNLERRFKVAYLHDNALIGCLSLSATVPDDCLSKVSLDVPPGTIVIRRGYSSFRMAEELVLWNAEWPLIPVGESLPEIVAKTTYIMVKGDIPRRESSCDQPLIRNAGTFTIEVKNQDGVTVKTMTFENPITVESGQTLVLSGFNLNTGEMVGEARLTGEFKINNAASIKGVFVNNPCGEITAELFDPALGEPSPFDKTWRDKPSQL